MFRNGKDVTLDARRLASLHSEKAESELRASLSLN